MHEKRFPDIFVLIAVSVLFLLGILVLYTTSPIGASPASWVDSLVIRQFLFGMIGILVIAFLVSIDPQLTKTLILQGFVWIVIAGMLLGLFLLGPIVNDTHRWYHIGQFLFQPSEFAKIATALWVAFWLTQEKIGLWRRVIFAVVGTLVIGLLVLLEPDFGSTITILAVMSSILIGWCIKFEFPRIVVISAVVTMCVFGLGYAVSWWCLLFLIPIIALFVRRSAFAGLVGMLVALVLFGAISGSVILWNSPYRKYLPDYVQTRITTFTGETNDARAVFQSNQAKIAIGSGGFWGKGLAQGTQTRLRFLPEYTTDFIFSAFVEERGFVGILLLIVVELLLFGRLFMLAVKVEDEYARLVIIGLIVKLWLETFVNIGMNMGILPTKGVALPFMSYGGSSLLANSIIIGIILSLYRFESKRDTISP